jgi:hypothetical protein
MSSLHVTKDTDIPSATMSFYKNKSTSKIPRNSSIGANNDLIRNSLEKQSINSQFESFPEMSSESYQRSKIKNFVASRNAVQYKNLQEKISSYLKMPKGQYVKQRKSQLMKPGQLKFDNGMYAEPSFEATSNSRADQKLSDVLNEYKSIL